MSTQPKPRTILDCSWDELHAYRFNVFPHSLVVITNAGPAEFEEATKQFEYEAFHEDGRNIEDIVQSRGFVAVTGLHHDLVITL